MLFSVIIPTLGTRVKELTRLLNSIQIQTYANVQVIIVSQDNHDTIYEAVSGFPDLDIDHIKSYRRGLSIARNLAIPFIKGDIVTFSDDDCWYPADSFEKVAQSFKDMQDSDVLCFQIYDPDQGDYYKNYLQEKKLKLNMRQIFQRSSIEIFIKMNSVNREDLFFNESFGLGAKYPSGEENILLVNLLRKNYTLSYNNLVVVYHAKPSQGSRLNLNAFRSKGPLFKQIFGPVRGFVMLTALFVKKYNALENPFQFYFNALKEMYTYKRQTENQTNIRSESNES